MYIKCDGFFEWNYFRKQLLKKKKVIKIAHGNFFDHA